MEMGICFRIVPLSSPPPFCMLGNFLSFFLSCPWIGVIGSVVFLWHGWLPGLSLYGERDPWAASFGQLASWELERCLGAYPADNSCFWFAPEFWDADDLALEMTDAPSIWTDGSGKTILLVGSRLLALVCISLHLKRLCVVLFGVLRRNMVMLDWSVAALSCRSLARFRLFSVLNFGVLLLLCSRTRLVIWALTTLMLPGQLVCWWIVGACLNLYLWFRMGSCCYCPVHDSGPWLGHGQGH